MTTPIILPRLSLAEHPTKVEGLLEARVAPWTAQDRPAPYRTVERVRWLWASLLSLALLDVGDDALRGATASHLAVELAAIGLVIASVQSLQRRLEESERLVASFSRHLERADREVDRWRGEARSYLDGLGEAIDRQFHDWQLTPSERDVGLLLLKGLSHKEIAGIRKTSEQTVRSQALTLYRKAGLRGRHDLAAYFLEDLLLPGQPDTDRVGIATESVPVSE
ncbi:MAG: LuxR C-terminal-related transcriptional regulator [bacterium]